MNIYKGILLRNRKSVMFKAADVKVIRRDKPIILIPGVGEIHMKKGDIKQLIKEWKTDEMDALASMFGQPEQPPVIPEQPEEEREYDGEPMLGPFSMEEAMEASGLTKENILKNMQAGIFDGETDPNNKKAWQIYFPEDYAKEESV